MKQLMSILTAFLLLIAGAANGQSKSLQEDLQDIYTIKALFIYNFTKYIEWPKMKPGAPFIIHVYGDNPVKERLEIMMKDRKVNDHPIVIKSGSQQDSLAQIIYVPTNFSGKVHTPFDKKTPSGILYITDSAKRNSKLQGINLLTIEDKIRFEINEAAIRKEGLKIASQLIELAVNNE
jgi:hypothetical protein